MCLPRKEENFNTTAEKDLLQKDYQIFMDIVSKVIECRGGSFNMFFSLKLRIMMTIWDESKIDWCGFILHRLVEEVGNVELNESEDIFKHKLAYRTLLSFIFEKTITNLGEKTAIHDYIRGWEESISQKYKKLE